MMNKTDLRVYAKNLRKKLNLKILSRIAVEKIRCHEIFSKSKNIMLYYPLKSELDLTELFNSDKKFFLPKVFNNDLLCCPLSEKLIKSDFNVLEPVSEPVNPEILDMVIVPALMADSKNYRLGYGLGFYDRFLPECTNAYKLVVIPKNLFVSDLPFDEHDFKVDEVLSI